MRKIAVFALTLSALISPPGVAQTVYKCKAEGKPTVYQNSPCPAGTKGSAAADYTAEAERQKASAAAGMAYMERQQAWEKLCGDGPYSYVQSCVSDHATDYDHMIGVRASEKSEVNLTRANQCYVQWFKATVDEVDAKMWRYCYYH